MAIAVPYTAIVLLSVYILNRIGIFLLKERSLSEHFFLISNIIIAVIRHGFIISTGRSRLLVFSCDHVSESLSLTAILSAQRLIDQQSLLLTQLFTFSRISLDTLFQLADLLIELHDLLCDVSHIITTVHFDFGIIPDDNIIARNTLLCLLAVRMNFGVSIEFCVRQIVMGNLFLTAKTHRRDTAFKHRKHDNSIQVT